MIRKNQELTGVEKPTSLVETAYNVIQDAIMHCELKPGVQLSEASLSKQLGISRTPVREALKRLEKEGLVHIVPRRGAFVTDISAEDIVEIYQLREALECYAIQFVPQNGDPYELERIASDLEQSLQWIEAGQYDRVNEADTRLHRYVAASSRNRLLIKLVDQLLSQVIRLRAMTPTVPGRLVQQAEEHLRIVRTLKAGSVDEAREALRGHLQRVRDTAIQIRLQM